MPDARIGTRNGSGIVTAIPTQYADGSSAPADVMITGTLVNLDAGTNFCALRPGTVELSEDLRDELTAAIGSSGVIGSYNSVKSQLGLSDIENPNVFDDFKGGTLDSAAWATDLSASATAAQPNDTGLTLVKIAVPATDDAHATLASKTTFSSSADYTLIETRLRLSHLTDLIVEFGFSDDDSETNGIAFSSHDSTPVAVATNAVLFGFQHDTGNETNTTWNALRVNGGTAVRIDTTVAPLTTFVTLEIALAKNGANVDASWFINGAQVATAASVVAANTQLYGWLTLKAKSATIRSVEADYIRITASR